MRKLLLAVLSLMAGTAFVAGQAPKTDHPSGTIVTKKHVETEVEPARKQVKVTSDLVRGAQVKLNAKGYDTGAATGTMNARTQAAIRSFQRDEKISVSGRLDEATLNKLNVGGTNMMTSAPSDAGRGAVAAGHNVKEGHPIAAGKAMGKGVGRFGKKVGKGTKALVVGTKDKVLGPKPKEEPQQNSEPK